MRFGTHSHDSHDIDLEKLDPRRERDRLVRMLRDVTERVERAPLDQITESLAFIVAALEPLTRLVERALGRPK